MAADSVLKQSVNSALLNVVSSVLLRLLTFAANAYVLRHVSATFLGVNVRLWLLYDTVLFLSRESFRNACLTRPESSQTWTRVVNLVWLAVPIGATSAACLHHLWTSYLEPPVSASLAVQYQGAVAAFAVSSVIMLATEPFYIVGQSYLHVKFRTAVDSAYIVANTFCQCLIVTLAPSQSTLYFSWAVLANSVLFAVLHVAYFAHILTKESKEAKKEDEENPDHLPFSSLRDFLPSFSPYEVDSERWALAVSFFKQGFLKQVLTEGEKYMFTWFQLMTLAEQGIYDVVANLGSIPARLFFAKLEESARLYFSLKVTRGHHGDMTKETAPSRHLWMLLKALVLTGFIVCTFGVFYCHALLHLYGGDLLSQDIGPTLLRAHCFYIMFLAVNGITECYAFCVMTDDELAAYNYKYGVMTLVFLTSTWVLAKVLGPVGFTLANMGNFAMRIAHNLRVIADRHADSEVRPLNNLLPRLPTLLTLGLAGVVCWLSESFLDDSTVKGIFLHIMVGGGSFIVTLLSVWKYETFLREFMPNKTKKYD